MTSAATTGSVLNVGMCQATVEFVVAREGDVSGLTVGAFLGIERGSSLLIGAVIGLSARLPAAADGPRSLIVVADLLGEVLRPDFGSTVFRRGLSTYPSAGDLARMLNSDELKLIFAVDCDSAISLGRLHQDPSIRAEVNVKNLVSKHFAVLGTTGVGKSSGVALLLQRILASQKDLRIFLLDPHNEYGRCFGDVAQILNPNNLKLPFWLFNFEEIVDVFFRGRPGVEDEVAIMSEIIPLAKAAYDAPRIPGDARLLRRTDARSSGFTPDTPVPYRLADVLSLIEDRLGKLENRSSAGKYVKLMSRIETVRNDRRYAFMFDTAHTGSDTMVDVISTLFSLPPIRKKMTIMQLAGFPTEVVDAVVSVVTRVAFDIGLWSDGALPILFMCEEAHRYAPVDRTLGFGPTRKALSRIAKEGRKYGVHLGFVTQRAGELDATILSQCSTIFAMRMANEQDQRIIRSAVSEAAASLLGFVPALGTREVLAFGEGVALPLRFIFDEVPYEYLPRGKAVQNLEIDKATLAGRDLVVSVVDRWRNATLSQRRSLELSDSQTESQRLATSAARHPNSALHQARQSETVPMATRDQSGLESRRGSNAARELAPAFRERRL